MTPGPKRTWDEDSLREAVINSTSWRGVARELGLSPKSGHTLKKAQATATDIGLDTSHFRGPGWNKGLGNGRNRDLARAASRRWYSRNAESEKRRNADRRIQLAEKIRSLKEAAPCEDCGRAFPYFVMDFDHRPGEIKEFNIGDAGWLGYSASRVMAEINKCDLVCSNCHRIRTAQRGGWGSATEDPDELDRLTHAE